MYMYTLTLAYLSCEFAFRAHFQCVVRTYDPKCVENANQLVSTQGKFHEYSYVLGSVSALICGDTITIMTAQAVRTATYVMTAQAVRTATGVMTAQAVNTATEIMTAQAVRTATGVMTTQAVRTATYVMTAQAVRAATGVMTTGR